MSEAAYSIVLDMTGRQAVVVGGGPAGARKARGLLAAGARVRVVSPTFHGEVPPEVDRVQDVYRQNHLADAWLVIAATDDPKTNEAVVREARRIGALAGRVDSEGADHGDFLLPAVWRQGALSVAVSTGHAPALAALIRDGIGEWIDPRWAAMAQVMTQVRPIILKAKVAPDRRREIFHALISDDALETAVQEGASGVLTWLAGRYADLGLPAATVREKEEL